MKIANKINFAADGINLDDIGNSAEWHRGRMIDALMSKGMKHNDAEAFTCFAINEFAILNDGVVDGNSEDLVSDEQWGRLAAVSSRTLAAQEGK